MKHILYLLTLIFALALNSCKGSTDAPQAAEEDSINSYESAEETQRFLDQEGDIVQDGDTTDYSRVPEDLPEEEDTEANLPGIED